MSFLRFVFKFAYNFQNVVVNKVTFAPVNSKHAVFRHLVQCLPQVYFVEEGNIAVEFDVFRFNSINCCPGNFVFSFKIILHNKVNRNQKPDAYSDNNNRYNEWKKLFPSQT